MAGVVVTTDSIGMLDAGCWILDAGSAVQARSDRSDRHSDESGITSTEYRASQLQPAFKQNRHYRIEYRASLLQPVFRQNRHYRTEYHASLLQPAFKQNRHYQYPVSSIQYPIPISRPNKTRTPITRLLITHYALTILSTISSAFTSSRSPGISWPAVR